MSREAWCFWLCSSMGLFFGALFADLVGPLWLAVIGTAGMAWAGVGLTRHDERRRLEEARPPRIYPR